VRITIRHRTSYAFDAPVFLEPHVIRLRPRVDGATRLVDFALNISPEPVVRTENLDPEGNVVTRAWFEGKWSRLTLDTHAAVDTLLTNPFEFLVTEPDRPLPYAYAPDFCERLALYRRPPDAAHPAVRELALAAAAETARDPARFPLALAQHIRAAFVRETRPEGGAMAPEATIAAGRGACRDLAVLFVSCCQAMGLAARFASGYAHSDKADSTELHAWGEVFLRGGGWRGYDPTQGLAVADRHVTVAAAADPLDAAPVTGTFRGDGVRANLAAEIELEAVAS
jgi:transglutaminase-like putative cysteine protease